MSMLPFHFGTGMCLPPAVVSSAELERRLQLPQNWIESRTGIRERRVAADGVGVSDLAVEAGKQALEAANLDADDLDLLILATSTPDRLLPPTAPTVAHRLGTRAGAFDLAGACCGFLQALTMAHGTIAIGAGAVLVIGANILSRRTNANDPNTAVLFGDGAGALALRRSDTGRRPLLRGQSGRILATHMASDGANADAIFISAGGSREPFTPEAWEHGAHLMRMPSGEAVFRLAVRAMRDAVAAACAKARLTPNEVRWLVPHQANARLMARVAEAWGFPPERVISTIATHGNTSAASIPLALHAAVTDGRVQPGDLVALTAAGAGFSAAAAVLQW